MIYEEFLELVKRSLEERMGEEYAFEITKTLQNPLPLGVEELGHGSRVHWEPWVLALLKI